jgi:LPS O-antigen subunit length determinant protein (WzzB/FepE family)
MTQSSEPYQKRIIYIPFDDQYKDPAVDLLKLLRVFWQGKYIILSICLICSLSALLISRYIIEPAYKASATISMKPESISHIERYLRSSDFKQDLAAGNDAPQHLQVKLAGYLSNEDQFPFSFSAIRARQGFLDIFAVDAAPASAVKILEKAIAEIKAYYQNNLTSQDQVLLDILAAEINDLKPKVDKIWQNYDKSQQITLPQFDLIKRYFSLKDRTANIEINYKLSRKFKVIQKPVPPLRPFKPDTRLIVIVTFILSLLISFVGVLLLDSLKKRHLAELSKN